MTKTILQNFLPVALLSVAMLFALTGFAAAQETTDDTTDTSTSTDEVVDDSATSTDDVADDADTEAEAEDESADEAEEEVSSLETLLATLQTLMAQVATLQERLAAVRGEVKEAREQIRADLREGVTDEDVERIQELLATDPEIYPEGLVTGYFGSLTKQALMRFQMRHNLEVDGEIDSDTKALLEEYLAEGFGDDIPAGLLRAPGIMKKVEKRFKNGCEENGRGMGPLCKKLKDTKDKNEDKDEDEDEEEEDKEDDYNDEDLEIKVEVENDTATVEIEYPDGAEMTVTYDFTTEEALIDTLVEEKDLDRTIVESVIEFEYEEEEEEETEEEA